MDISHCRLMASRINVNLNFNQFEVLALFLSFGENLIYIR